MADGFLELSEIDFPKIIFKNKVGDRMIKQLLNSVIAKNCDLYKVVGSGIIPGFAKRPHLQFTALWPAAHLKAHGPLHNSWPGKIFLTPTSRWLTPTMTD